MRNESHVLFPSLPLCLSAYNVLISLIDGGELNRLSLVHEIKCFALYFTQPPLVPLLHSPFSRQVLRAFANLRVFAQPHVQRPNVGGVRHDGEAPWLLVRQDSVPDSCPLVML